jgi:hypothetical protein
MHRICRIGTRGSIAVPRGGLSWTCLDLEALLNLQAELLWIPSTHLGQLDLFPKTRLGSQQDRFCRLRSSRHQHGHRLHLAFRPQPDLLQLLEHLIVIHAGSQLEYQVQFILEPGFHRLGDRRPGGYQSGHFHHPAIREIQRILQARLGGSG